MEGLDIEVRGQPGPAKSTLEAALRRLGYRVREPGAAGPQADLLLLDTRGAPTPSDAELAFDPRPTLLVAETAPTDLCESVQAHEHVVVVVDSAASEATLRVALSVCAMIGGRQAAAA